MSFFDDKQEILKLELTTYGRYLIARGKFKPAYYAFFDDDIIYDGQYANLEETQNSIQTRILDETLSLKPQTTYTSVQNNVTINTLLSRDIDKLKEEEAQISSDKNYALSLPLANSSISSDYSPSWALRILNGKISSVEQHLDNSQGNLDILQPFIKYPQINLEDRVYDIKKAKNNSSTETDFNIINVFTSGSDEYYYSLKESPLIIDLKEMNVDDLVNNFDVEIFIVEETSGSSGIKTNLNQLKFKKDPISILNGILLDETITYDLDEDPSLAEYFFETTVDDEIELPPQQKALALRTSGSANGPFGVDC